MRTSRRAAGLAAAALVAVMVGAASFAWACTIQARVGAINPNVGPPGTRVSVSASQFNPGPVEIRWNSTSGPVLATANGPSFTVGFSIPDAPPEIYSVVAVQRSGGNVIGKASGTFEVSASNAFESGGHTTSSSSDPTTSGAATEGVTSGSQAASGDPRNSLSGTDPSSTSTSSSNGGAAFPSETSSESSATPLPIAATGSAASDRAPAANTSAVAKSPSAPEATSPGSSGQSSTMAAPSADEEAVVPAGAALADLWSGFEQGYLDKGASLLEPDTEALPSPASIGAGVMSVGLLAIFSGFGVAEVRRRREVAARSGVTGG